MHHLGARCVFSPPIAWGRSPASPDFLSTKERTWCWLLAHWRFSTKDPEWLGDSHSLKLNGILDEFSDGRFLPSETRFFRSIEPKVVGAGSTNSPGWSSVKMVSGAILISICWFQVWCIPPTGVTRMVMNLGYTLHRKGWCPILRMSFPSWHLSCTFKRSLSYLIRPASSPVHDRASGPHGDVPTVSLSLP